MHGSRRISVSTTLLAAALVITGCSGGEPSVLIFGTDTKLAFDVSQDVTGTGTSLTLGYKRREAVWLPLFARTGTGNYDCGPPSGEGKPVCTIAQAGKGNHQCTTGGDAPNAQDSQQKALTCLLSGQAELIVAKDGQDKVDAYSVLASFGAKKGEGQTGELSQYIATGFAARALAEKSGAAAVNSNALTPAASAQAQARIEEKQAAAKTVVDYAGKDTDGTVNDAHWQGLLTKAGYGDADHSLLQALKGDTPAVAQEKLSSFHFDAYLPKLLETVKAPIQTGVSTEEPKPEPAPKIPDVGTAG